MSIQAMEAKEDRTKREERRRPVERATARPAEEWDKSAALPSIAAQADELSVPDAAEKSNGAETTEVATTVAGMTPADIQADMQRLEWLGEHVDGLNSRAQRLKSIVTFLTEPAEELMTMELPLYGFRHVLHAMDVFMSLGFETYRSTREDRIAARIIGRIRKQADAGGLPDPAVFEDLRSRALKPFQEKMGQLDEQLGASSREIADITGRLIGEQVARVERTMSIYNRSRGQGQKPGSGEVVELERAIFETDWGVRKKAPSAESPDTLSARSEKYSIAGMILHANDPSGMCRLAMDSLAAERSRVAQGEAPYIEKELFPLVLALHLIAKMDSHRKRRLHLDIVSAELQALNKGLAGE